MFRGKVLWEGDIPATYPWSDTSGHSLDADYTGIITLQNMPVHIINENKMIKVCYLRRCLEGRNVPGNYIDMWSSDERLGYLIIKELLGAE